MHAASSLSALPSRPRRSSPLFLSTFANELWVSALFAGVVAAGAALFAVGARALGLSVFAATVDVDARYVAVVGVIPAFVSAWLFCAGRRLAFRSAARAAVVASGAVAVGVAVHDTLLRSTYYLTDSPLSVFVGDISVGGCLSGVRDTSEAWPLYAALVVGAGIAAAALHRWAAAPKRRA